MIKVLEVRPDGTAVVSTEGLRRVVTHPGSKVSDELATPSEADAFVHGFTDPRGSCWAESIDYAEVARREAAGNVAAELQLA